VRQDADVWRGSVAVAPLFLQCQLVFRAETANSIMLAQANTKASLVRGLTPSNDQHTSEI
jgi:hypothetical protein